MKKYEIKTDSFELRYTKAEIIPDMTAKEVFDLYLRQSANDPSTEESFNTLEEAKAEFSKYYASYGSTRMEESFSFNLLRGEVAWIEENEYDEDGEFNYGGDVCEFNAQGYDSEDDHGVRAHLVMLSDGFEAAVSLMDDDIRESVHADGYEDEEEFLAEYMRRHYEKYGENFRLPV